MVSRDNIEREACALLDRGRVVFFLEPASPFDDLCSLNLEPDVNWREWLIEVVGAGFDAGDLKRGLVTPHEQIRAVIDDAGVPTSKRVVATDEIQATVRNLRLDHIATMLDCGVQDVATTLHARGETLFLDSPNYRAIPDALLTTAIRSALRLRPELARLGLGDRGVSISLSFLSQQARMVFWDVVWPDRKYVVGNA